MKIQVLHNYGGKLTKEQRILPAIYDTTDERLFGLADYLVINRHAIIVEYDTAWTGTVSSFTSVDTQFVDNALTVTTQEGNTIPDTVLETPDYEALTLDELRHLLQAYEFTEDDIVSDMSAHWTIRRKELVEWFTKR